MQLDAFVLRAIPPAALQRRICGRDVARLCKHQRDRVLGRAQNIRLRRVDDEHPSPRRRLEIDVVDADPRATDDLQLRPTLEQLCVGLRRRPNDQGVVIADDVEQLLAGKVGPNVDLDALIAQAGDPCVGDRFRDENFHPAWVKTSSAAATASPRFTG